MITEDCPNNSSDDLQPQKGKSLNQSNVLAKSKQEFLDLSESGLRLSRKIARRASSMTPEHNLSIFSSKINLSPKKKPSQHSNSRLLSQLFSLFQPAMAIIRKKVDSKIDPQSQAQHDDRSKNALHRKESTHKTIFPQHSTSQPRKLSHFVDRDRQKSTSKSTYSTSPFPNKKKSILGIRTVSQKHTQKANEYLMDHPSAGVKTPEEYTLISPQNHSCISRPKTAKLKQSIFQPEKSQNRMEFQHLEELRQQIFAKMGARESEKQSDCERETQKMHFNINKSLPQDCIGSGSINRSKEPRKKTLIGFNCYKNKRLQPRKPASSLYSPNDIKGVQLTTPATQSLPRPKNVVGNQVGSGMTASLKVKRIFNRLIA